MENMDYTGDRVTRWMRYIARALALIWAGWWTLFGLACGLSEGMRPAGVLLHAAFLDGHFRVAYYGLASFGSQLSVSRKLAEIEDNCAISCSLYG